MTSIFNILRRTPARRGLDASNWSLYYQHADALPAVEAYTRRCQEMPEYEWKLERVDRTILSMTEAYEGDGDEST